MPRVRTDAKTCTARSQAGESTTGDLAASAWADGPDAVWSSVTQAVGSLSGQRPSLLLLFPDGAFSHQEIVDQARAAAPDVPLAGMTSDGLMTEDGVRLAGCTAMAFGEELSVGVGISQHASSDFRSAGRIAAECAMRHADPRPGHSLLLMFLDASSGDQADAIDGAYSVVGAGVQLAGGGANGQSVSLLAGDVCCDDAVVAVSLGSEKPIGIGIGQGCRPLAHLSIATRTNGRTLCELDGRPAEEVYLEGLNRGGEELSDEEFQALAVLHPLGQPELRGQLRLRHIHGRAPGGGLACSTPIPPTAAVWFTEQTTETIVDSAATAVQSALAPLEGDARAVLVFDCAARRHALGGALGEEAQALLSSFGTVPSLMGLYTRGEVGRSRGAKGDRNHAVVVVAFG
ncbi:MAG: FIST C-terminal domain-containing protein [Actinomycetota bacterium]|nr:FIST C-terminal domain-containing protein [Actinomycetota bacterium]